MRFPVFDSQPRSFWGKNIETLPKKWLTIVDISDQYIVDEWFVLLKKAEP